MIDPEEDEANGPGPNDPTPDEIANRCLVIQAFWTAETRENRLVVPTPGPYTLSPTHIEEQF